MVDSSKFSRKNIWTCKEKSETKPRPRFIVSSAGMENCSIIYFGTRTRDKSSQIGLTSFYCRVRMSGRTAKWVKFAVGKVLSFTQSGNAFNRLRLNNPFSLDNNKLRLPACIPSLASSPCPEMLLRRKDSKISHKAIMRNLYTRRLEFTICPFFSKRCDVHFACVL